MNFFSNYRFTLDIQKNKTQASIPVHYGDTGNRFYITLTDGGNPYIIPDGCRVDLYMKKPDNRPLVNACIIENNSLVRYEFNKNTASVEGIHKCELRIYSPEGRLITTPSFIMVVDQRVIYDDEIGTEEDFQKLYALGVIATEEQRVAAEAERGVAEKAREEAEKARAEAEKEREAAEAARREYYDLVITSEDDFDKLLYPLFKNDDALTRDEAVLKVSDEEAFNAPSLDFTAKRVLVRGVTFTRMRGYDDVRLHIFQPSIEYIKFDECRWETPWYVSGKAPTVLAESNTEFKRADGFLDLVIDGIEVTADNVQAAKDAGAYWYIGLRNIKALVNSTVRYPERYDIGNGWGLKLTCQYFDYASNNKIPAFWDGANVSDCYVIEKLVRCTNCANIVADPVLKNGAQNAVSVRSCKNLSNFSGTFAFDGCENISATKEDVAAAEENAKKDAESNFVRLQGSGGLKMGEYFVYANGITADGKTVQTQVHTRPTAAKSEIPLRTEYGTLLSEREWSDNNYDYSDATKWSPATLMPRDYIDQQIAKRAPLEGGKIPASYLPSYVDDVLEYTNQSSFPSTGEPGKIYVDKDTNKTYRWSGSKYAEISASLALGTTHSSAFYGDWGQEAYNHSQIKGNPHGTTLDDILPVTAEDNGKILQVVDGAWGAVTIPTAEGGSF